MPKLWNAPIEEHRHAVRQATLAATAAVVAREGVRGVTMSAVAKEAGIARATLYRYFPDVESVLLAWHEDQLARHLAQLRRLGAHAGTHQERLAAVLSAFATILSQHPQHPVEIAAVLHRGEHVAHAHAHLIALIRGLITDGAAVGAFRTDVPPDELATFCLHALSAASAAPSQPAVRRLIEVTMAALAPT